MNARKSLSTNAEATAGAPEDDATALPADSMDALADSGFDERSRPARRNRESGLAAGPRERQREGIDPETLHRAVADLARRVETVSARRPAEDDRPRRADPYDDYGRSETPVRRSRYGSETDETLQLLDRLEERLGMMASSRHASGHRERRAPSRSETRDRAWSPPAPDIDRHFRAIETRLDRLDHIADQAGIDDIRSDISELGRQMDGLSRSESILSGRMGAIQRQLAELHQAVEDRDSPQTDRLAAIEDRFAQFADRIPGQAFSSEAEAALEQSYRDIHERIEEIEKLTRQAIAPEDFSDRIEQLRATLADMPSASSISALESRIHGLYDRIDHMADGVARTDELSGLESRLSEVADTVATLRQADPAEIRDQLASLAERVDQLAVENRPVDLTSVENRLNEIAALAAKAAETDSAGALWKIEERLDDLAYAISEQDRRLAAQDITALAQSLDDLRGYVAAQDFSALRVGLDAIHTRFDGLDATALGERLDALQAQIFAIGDHPNNDGALKELNARIEGISRRVESLAMVSDPGPVETRLAGIETTLRDATSESLAGLEPIRERLEEIGSTLSDDREGEEILARLEEIGRALSDDRESEEILARLDEIRRAMSSDREAEEILARLEQISGVLASDRDSEEILTRLAEISGAMAADREGEEILARLDEIGRALSDDRNGDEVVARLEEIKGALASDREAEEILARLEEINRAMAADRDGQEILARLDEIKGVVATDRDGQEILARLIDIQECLAAATAEPDPAAGAATHAEQQLTEIRNQLAQIGSDVGARDLGEKLDLLNSTLAAAETLATQEEIGELRTDLAALRHELQAPRHVESTSSADGALAPILHEITERLDRLADETPLTYRDLEGQISRLVRHLDGMAPANDGDVGQRLADIQAMLQEIGELVSQPGGHAYENDETHTAQIVSAIADRLGSDLASLKHATAATEDNTRRALEAVHETLEAVVKRLAFLERDQSLSPDAPPDETDDQMASDVSGTDGSPDIAAASATFAEEEVPLPNPEFALPSEAGSNFRPDEPSTAPSALPGSGMAEPLSAPEPEDDEASLREITISDLAADADPDYSGNLDPPMAVMVTDEAADSPPKPETPQVDFETLLNQHRLPAADQDDDGDRSGADSLLGRLTSSQLLRRATGGRADSFSPDPEEPEESVEDTLLEPGTDDPLASSLEDAPMSEQEEADSRQRAMDAAARAEDPMEAPPEAPSDEPPQDAESDKADEIDENDIPTEPFLSAARRAAQAAAAEANLVDDVGLDSSPGVSRVVGRLNANRKVVLASAVAIVVAFAALQFTKTKLLNLIGPAPVENSNATAIKADGDPTISAAATEEPGQTTIQATASPTGGSDPAATVTPDDSIAFASPDSPAALVKPKLIASAAEDVPAAPDSERVLVAKAAPTELVAASSAGESSDSAASPVDETVFPTPPEAIGSERLREEAATGNPVAMFEVATRLATGRNVPADITAAARWYSRAAEAGLAPAQYRLGSLYEKGQGVERSSRAAEAWYRRAAVAGNAKAMHNLAVLYAEGAGGDPDLKAAAGWFRRAAELGIRDSQFNIAILHARGLGVPEDYAEAYKWFAIAAVSGDEQAATRRDAMAKGLSRKALAAAENAVENFKPAKLDPAANLVVPPSDNWGQTDPEKISQNMKSLIMRTQELLASRGYNLGQPDGVFGPRTRDAIAAFQRDSGLPVDGRVDTTLLATLEARAI